MRVATSLDELYTQLKGRKLPFFVAFFVVVILSYAFLYAIDFVPEPIKKEQPNSSVSSTVVTEEVKIDEENEVFVAHPLPNKIIFDSLDNKEVLVLNPQSRAIVDLDEALLNGAVRHPDSANFQDIGNIFILAHSSYLPNVLNKNFQAFNGIQNLVWGDRIRLQSEDVEYIYRVENTFKASANDILVPFTPGEARLTLATCNSFGSKDDRFVVEAVLIGTRNI
ncbi:sortase [Candidatus Kaiserbacteria bacterium]|nr:sortase [Candidatus Kaiserbacteria bacterium]